MSEARTHVTSMGLLKVIGLEGLIAFKLQGYFNDASRTQDLYDIKQPIRHDHEALDIPRLRHYFSIFEGEALFDELVAGQAMADTQSKPQPLLVREGGVRHEVRYSDPFAAFLDLMEVVEALCPRWPERKPSVGRDYRL